ncbi:2-chlorobenzoate 1,2-dioxygenase [Novosphingobium aromaticivorans DSM 12444]|uniref:2-chlorobenzoate 1,2-dioxygenase n=1 Tax=Novosphingobium aromaticivorans (strain ATCC 700278 / DSM 12444 / CCUG 56034 / CIP 105152 / NBRC 16084 / F199) TaxID=279238 RepID=Q2GAY7_NOVAD|nr:benzoate 1,2-dioxygenase small subunit [Novosphingobium aromaticivorans]ABD24986.1 2-chlorobenzoate 1,2-dioxygenase [Novosphingobium aromaticivorans DSM 12444]SCY86504.1 benzoate/toluate 1,2-dioxygenase beta subunit [Novosphingobium aromaticivorans]
MSALDEVCAFLHREARLLDDRQLDVWLECYAPDCTYWMPAWTDDDELVTDPQSQISLIYYANRQGLEDRVYRLETERSSASTPEPRTVHMLANIELLEDRGDELDVRYNWHTLSHRFKVTSQFFGVTFCTLRRSMDGFSIGSKKVVLKNDYIHQVIDVYHV